MNIKRLALLISCMTILTGSAHACELHYGFGGGAFGSKWEPYDPDGDYSDSSEEDTASTEETQKARPVFSSSALRSSDSAKAKLAERDEEADTEDQNTTDE